MMEALAIGLTAQRALEKAVESISYNLANGSTAGFRASQVTFETFEGQIGGRPTSFVKNASGYISGQRGSLSNTGNMLDIAASEHGWFGVQTADGIGYTKDGRFGINPNGLLVTSEQLPVTDSSGAAILLDPAGDAPRIKPDGSILQNGNLVGSLGIFVLPEDANLQRSTPLVFRSSRPGDAQTGENAKATVLQGFLEMSNVNPLSEMTRLIAAQRLFESTTALLESCEATFSDAVRTLGSRS